MLVYKEQVYSLELLWGGGKQPQRIKERHLMAKVLREKQNEKSTLIKRGKKSRG